MTSSSHLTRRQFVRHASASLLLSSVPVAARAHAPGRSGRRPDDLRRRLAEGWMFRRGPLSAAQARTGHGSWQPVTLPHCTNADDACDPDRPYFQGESWYRLSVAAHNPFPRGRTLLVFRGAGQTTRVWAGEALLGTHTGGYDEFAIDLGPAVRAGESLDLLVCCDSTPDGARSPSNLSDFCLYGGLYRHVELVYLPAVALDAVRIRQTTGASGPATLEVEARLFGKASEAVDPVAFRVELFDPAGLVLHDARGRRDAWQGAASLASIAVPDPARWSPDAPQLYRCRVTVGSGKELSVVEERVGIRHIAFPEQGLFALNGQPLFLKGTQRHQDCAESAGAQSDASVEREMHLIKAMGANFVRLGHYQQDRLVLDLCDELGLLVWEEAPWCRAGVGGEAWQTSTRRQLERMIDQHCNHPSIVFWGLGNEDDWPEEKPSVDRAAIRRFMAELNDRAHALDDTRLTSYRRCDFARDIPDIYSPSVWAGWYNGSYREYAESLAAQRGRQKRLLHIEWGADSHAGRHSEDPYQPLEHLATGTGSGEERDGDYPRSGGAIRVSRDGDWSETYACDLFDWYLKEQETMPWLAGSAQWVFKDFASPLRADSPIPRVNQKGVLERDLTPKESYAVFQSYWSTRPMIHIYGHSWPRRWGSAGQSRLVKVYSNCGEAELFLNGVSLGGRRRDSQNFPAANLRWQAVFRPGRNTLRAVGRQGESIVEDEIELDYVAAPWSAPARLRLRRVPGEPGMLTLQAEILDRDGRRCLDSRLPVRFSATGTAAIVDNRGTRRGSRALEAANGAALVSLVPGGTGTVTAATPGLPPATLNIMSSSKKG